MTTNTGAHGTNLAADLLADLAQPLPPDRRPTSPDSVTAQNSHSSPPAGDAHVRGPAFEGSLRISPLTWRRPRLAVGAQSATIGFGPLHARLGIHV